MDNGIDLVLIADRREPIDLQDIDKLKIAAFRKVVTLLQAACGGNNIVFSVELSEMQCEFCSDLSETSCDKYFLHVIPLVYW